MQFPYDTRVWFHELTQYQCQKNKLNPKSTKSMQVYFYCRTDKQHVKLLMEHLVTQNTDPINFTE
jgi:hypothetical protein